MSRSHKKENTALWIFIHGVGDDSFSFGLGKRRGKDGKIESVCMYSLKLLTSCMHAVVLINARARKRVSCNEREVWLMF